jgi:hypothetical protein
MHTDSATISNRFCLSGLSAPAVCFKKLSPEQLTVFGPGRAQWSRSNHHRVLRERAVTLLKCLSCVLSGTSILATEPLGSDDREDCGEVLRRNIPLLCFVC